MDPPGLGAEIFSLQVHSLWPIIMTHEGLLMLFLLLYEANSALRTTPAADVLWPFMKHTTAQHPVLTSTRLVLRVETCGVKAVCSLHAMS